MKRAGNGEGTRSEVQTEPLNTDVSILWVKPNSVAEKRPSPDLIIVGDTNQPPKNK